MLKNKITKLSFQKNSQRINVFLDGEFSFGLSTEVALKAGLKINQELSIEEIQKLLSDSFNFELYQKSLVFLSIRPHSVWEMKQYLKKCCLRLREKTVILQMPPDFFAHQDTLINQIIERLLKNHLLDDEEFSSWWVEQRLAFKPRGKYALEAELMLKKVDKTVIHKVLGDKKTLSPSTNKEMINQLLQKAWKAISGRRYDKYKAKEVLSRRLLSKGFSWDEIKSQIDDFVSQQYNRGTDETKSL